MDISEITITSKHDLTDNDLCRFWHCVREAGRDRAVFYDCPPMDDQGFADFVRRPDVSFWMERADGVNFAAFWLTDRRGETADLHFCVLPVGSARADGEPLPITAGRKAFEVLFSLRSASGSPVFAYLVGKTPANNAPALKFARRLGGIPCGAIPGGAWFHADGKNVDLVINKFERA